MDEAYGMQEYLLQEALAKSLKEDVNKAVEEINARNIRLFSLYRIAYGDMTESEAEKLEIELDKINDHVATIAQGLGKRAKQAELSKYGIEGLQKAYKETKDLESLKLMLPRDEKDLIYQFTQPKIYRFIEYLSGILTDHDDSERKKYLDDFMAKLLELKAASLKRSAQGIDEDNGRDENGRRIVHPPPLRVDLEAVTVADEPTLDLEAASRGEQEAEVLERRTPRLPLPAVRPKGRPTIIVSPEGA